MIVLHGTPSQDRIGNMGAFVNSFRSGIDMSRLLPTCRRERDRCFRRWLLVAGGYWPTDHPTSVASDSDARKGVEALQADLGVKVDGTWWTETQHGLERALGRLIPEAVPPGGFPSPSWSNADRASITPRQQGGELSPPVSTAKKAGIVMASVGMLAVLGAAFTAWMLRRRKRA